jgi:Fe-S cluster assembly ATPase SufC
VTNHELLIRAIVRAALLANAGSPKSALEQIITGNYTTNFSDGRILVHTAEAGGECQFAVPAGMSALDILALTEEAIQFIENQPDPSNICLTTRRVTKLKASFRDKNFGAGGFNGVSPPWPV